MKPSYLKDNPIFESDFQTYDYKHINVVEKKKTIIKSSIGTVNVERS